MKSPALSLSALVLYCFALSLSALLLHWHGTPVQAGVIVFLAWLLVNRRPSKEA
jgi:hypothetical protein